MKVNNIMKVIKMILKLQIHLIGYISYTEQYKSWKIYCTKFWKIHFIIKINKDYSVQFKKNISWMGVQEILLCIYGCFPVKYLSQNWLIFCIVWSSHSQWHLMQGFCKNHNNLVSINLSLLPTVQVWFLASSDFSI